MIKRRQTINDASVGVGLRCVYSVVYLYSERRERFSRQLQIDQRKDGKTPVANRSRTPHFLPASRPSSSTMSGILIA